MKGEIILILSSFKILNEYTLTHAHTIFICTLQYLYKKYLYAFNNTDGGSPITLRQLQFPSWINANGKQQKVDVITRANCAYENLGMLLLQDDNLNIVKALELKHSNDMQKVTKDFFSKWIDGGGLTPVTWQALIGVFREIDLNTLADEI